MDNNLPAVDLSTYRPFASTTPQTATPTPGLPPVDMSTYRALGELSATEKPVKPITSGGTTSADVAQGVGTAAAQSLSNLGSIGGHIPGVSYVAGKVGDVLGLPKLAENADPYATVNKSTAANAAAANQTTGGKVGTVAENVAEFVLGDEALKGLSFAKRAGILQKIAALAETHPVLAKIIGHGLDAVRTGAVGTAQGLAHGESLPQAATSGAVAGGTGLALGAATEGVRSVAPYVKEIAGESIPVRASQESGLATKLENVAPTKALSKFDVQATQPAAKRAIGNVASEIGSKEISGQTLATQAKDLGERASQIQAQSKPVFEKLDHLTKDNDLTFSDLQRQERAAYRSGDIEAAKKAKNAQADILNTYKDQFAPQDFENARANWRQASALQDVHDSLNTKAIVGPTPVEFRPEGTSDPGYINGKQFTKQIIKLRDDGTLARAGLTPEHIQSLQDLGTLLEKSSNVHKFGQLAKLTELGGAGLTAVLHPAAAIAGAKVAVPAYLIQRALGRVMTNPETAETFVNLLKGAGVVAPAIAAQVTK